jgi:chromate reductase, NAD(P)H dehydrogenase (quinone)
MRVLAISGSLRAGSHNSELLRAAAAVAPGDVEFEFFDGLKEIPPYDADDDVPGDQPVAVRRLKSAIADADAVLIATPEYNHSIPGVLKNALDWVSRPLLDSPCRHRPVAVVSASTGVFGGVWAAGETRKVLGALGAHVLEDTVAVGKAHDRLADGADEKLQEELRDVLAGLAREVDSRLEVAV